MFEDILLLLVHLTKICPKNIHVNMEVRFLADTDSADSRMLRRQMVKDSMNGSGCMVMNLTLCTRKSRLAVDREFVYRFGRLGLGAWTAGRAIAPLMLLLPVEGHLQHNSIFSNHF